MPGCRDSYRAPSPHQWRSEAMIEALVGSPAWSSALAENLLRGVALSSSLLLCVGFLHDSRS